jgi:hypothetical protein
MPTSPDTPRCGAKGKLNRPGQPCALVAGHGTTHKGIGRCKYHGGNTPIKHGRYSTIRNIRLRDLIEKHAEDPDPLNMIRELSVARAALEHYLDVKKPDPRTVAGLANVISRIIKRAEDIEAANAISRPEFMRLMRQMAVAVKKALVTHITDPGLADRLLRDIALEWEGIRI